MFRAVVLFAALFSLVSTIQIPAANTNTAREYSKHFGALTELSVAVAQAMPPAKFGFRPHPESMTFGEPMSHIATTNYQFCAALKDSALPALPTLAGKAAIVKFLSASFDYCAAVIPNLTEEQLNMVNNSPDGNLPGREVLLAMYIHVAHHRGQADVTLADGRKLFLGTSNPDADK